MDVGYIRVSSRYQNTERQLDGVSCEKIFEDKCSGISAERPELINCIEFIREGDTLHVHSIDRLARNLEDLLRLIRQITGKGVTLIFHKESMTFLKGDSNPTQKLILEVMGAVAEFERSLIRERQREGIAIAKTKGRFKGRPHSRSPEEIAGIVQEAKERRNISEVARKYKISRTILYKWMREIEATKSNKVIVKNK